MRLNVTNDRALVSELIFIYLKKVIIDRKVSLILNGEKKQGVIKKIEFLPEENHMVFHLLMSNKAQQKFLIPLFDETDVRLGKELMVLYTKNHSTVLEVFKS